MPSIYANPSLDRSAKMDVVFVVYPDIVLLDLVGPLQVFSHARKAANADAAYRASIVSQVGGQIRTNTVLPIDSDPIDRWLSGPARTQIHTLVVVGGDGAIPAARDPFFVALVKRLADRSTRICSVCSGALIIAAAGLLDGRRAVTHWEDCERLAKDNPQITVEKDPIYVKDGNIWTSAGITAGIDMALAMIEEDLGRSAAIEMARSLVTPMVRAGGQSQFSPELDRQARDTLGRFEQLHEWISTNLQRKLSVDDLAEHSGMSVRNFSRQYTATMGTPPAKAIEGMRVDAARGLLLSTDLSVNIVAAQCGFVDDERMRRAFLRQINISPSLYRNQFR